MKTFQQSFYMLMDLCSVLKMPLVKANAISELNIIECNTILDIDFRHKINDETLNMVREQLQKIAK